MAETTPTSVERLLRGWRKTLRNGTRARALSPGNRASRRIEVRANSGDGGRIASAGWILAAASAGINPGKRRNQPGQSARPKTDDRAGDGNAPSGHDLGKRNLELSHVESRKNRPEPDPEGCSRDARDRADDHGRGKHLQNDLRSAQSQAAEEADLRPLGVNHPRQHAEDGEHGHGKEEQWEEDGVGLEPLDVLLEHLIAGLIGPQHRLLGFVGPENLLGGAERGRQEVGRCERRVDLVDLAGSAEELGDSVLVHEEHAKGSWHRDEILLAADDIEILVALGDADDAEPDRGRSSDQFDGSARLDPMMGGEIGFEQDLPSSRTSLTAGDEAEPIRGQRSFGRDTDDAAYNLGVGDSLDLERGLFD